MNKQKQRRENGKYAENFIQKMFRCKKSNCESYDLESKNCLIEVKSCVALNKYNNGKGTYSFHLGRFIIITDNHIELYLKALQKNKKPIYAFVLKIGKNMIYKIVKWSDIIVMNDKDMTQISWGNIFSCDLR